MLKNSSINYNAQYKNTVYGAAYVVFQRARNETCKTGTYDRVKKLTSFSGIFAKTLGSQTVHELCKP